MKRKIIIGVIIVTMFVMLAIAPSAGQQAQSNVKSDSTGTGYCDFNWGATDIFGKTVLKASFSASWLYSCQSGNLVHEYTPTSTAHAVVPIISWVKVDKPAWSNPVTDRYVAYGNVAYHVRILYIISYTQYSHATVTVKAHSYGSGTPSDGPGEYN